MKIYVNFEIPKTLKEFLEKFFFGGEITGYNEIPQSGFSVETYRDKKCIRLQCPAGRSRSIQDTYACVTTYFPTVTLETLVKALVKLKNGDKRFYPSRCSEIRRPVIGYYPYPRTYPAVASKSEWDWNKLLKRAGINKL